MFRNLFGTTLLGVAAISGFVMGCTTGDVDDSPTPSPSPDPEVAPFTVGADCTAGASEADDVVALSLDTSVSHLSISGGSVELYDDPTKDYCKADPTNTCYGEFHTLELFLSSGTSGGSDYYEIWERELEIAVDGNGAPDLDFQETDLNTVFTCGFFSGGEVTWVFYGTDSSSAEEYCIAGGKAPEVYAATCDVAE